MVTAIPGRIWLTIPLKLRKFLLSCIVIALMVAMAELGSVLFTQQVAPLPGSIIFIIEAIVLLVSIRATRSSKYRRISPRFGVVLLGTVAVVAVLAFAGVEPLSTYKDNLWGWAANRVADVREAVGSWSEGGSSSEANQPEPLASTDSATAGVTTGEVSAPQPSDSPQQLTPTLAGRQGLEEVEREVFNLINQERAREGLNPTVWDDNLYRLSKSHTDEMANRGELFHTPTGETYAENAWGASWGGTRRGLAERIVGSWMSSPLHRAWILHVPLRVSVVSIVDDERGQWSSWTFKLTNDGGPPLIQKAYDIYLAETGGRTPWLEWLYDVKGYPSNTSWLLP